MKGTAVYTFLTDYGWKCRSKNFIRVPSLESLKAQATEWAAGRERNYSLKNSILDASWEDSLQTGTHPAEIKASKKTLTSYGSHLSVILH